MEDLERFEGEVQSEEGQAEGSGMEDIYANGKLIEPPTIDSAHTVGFVVDSCDPVVTVDCVCRHNRSQQSSKVSGLCSHARDLSADAMTEQQLCCRV